MERGEIGEHGRLCGLIVRLMLRRLKSRGDQREEAECGIKNTVLAIIIRIVRCHCSGNDAETTCNFFDASKHVIWEQTTSWCKLIGGRVGGIKHIYIQVNVDACATLCAVSVSRVGRNALAAPSILTTLAGTCPMLEADRMLSAPASAPCPPISTACSSAMERKPGTLVVRACQQRPVRVLKLMASRKSPVNVSGVLQSPCPSNHTMPTGVPGFAVHDAALSAFITLPP